MAPGCRDHNHQPRLGGRVSAELRERLNDELGQMRCRSRRCCLRCCLQPPFVSISNCPHLRCYTAGGVYTAHMLDEIPNQEGKIRLAVISVAGLAAESLECDKVVGQPTDLFTLQPYIKNLETSQMKPAYMEQELKRARQLLLLYAGAKDIVFQISKMDTSYFNCQFLLQVLDLPN